MKDRKMATRDAVGHALVELGEENKDVVVLDADLSTSTKTAAFKEKFPSRFFDCGIAEANMIGVAAGLSTTGKIPFAASFAIFVAGRAFEQIRNSICYPNLNVKIIGSHSGFSSSEDGATHQAIEDIAILRAVPDMTIISPCDYFETFAAIKKAASFRGPVYIRTGKFLTSNVNGPEYIENFEIGKGVVLKKGSVVCLIATGVEVYFSLKAAELLEEEGIKTAVVNISTIKPLDEELILDIAKDFEFLFTVEEHSVIGGLYSAVCELLCEKYPKMVHKIGIKDKFGESATTEELLKNSGLDAHSIYNKVKQVILNKDRNFNYFSLES